MELDGKFEQNIDVLPGSRPSPSVSTSLRLQYEAQVQVIKNQIGTLEVVRGTLGLSQRKMCQLLLVDPSAWTRWTKAADGAPPHIWRALQWYMTLQQKIPGLTPEYFLGAREAAKMRQISDIQGVKSDLLRYREEIDLLKQRVKFLRQGLFLSLSLLGFFVLLFSLRAFL